MLHCDWPSHIPIGHVTGSSNMSYSCQTPFWGRGGGGGGGGHEIRREEDRKEEKRTGESVRGKVHV